MPQPEFRSSHMTLGDTRAGFNPFIIGFHHLREVVIGDDAIGGSRTAADQGNSSGLNQDNLQIDGPGRRSTQIPLNKLFSCSGIDSVSCKDIAQPTEVCRLMRLGSDEWRGPHSSPLQLYSCGAGHFRLSFGHSSSDSFLTSGLLSSFFARAGNMLQDTVVHRILG